MEVFSTRVVLQTTQRHCRSWLQRSAQSPKSSINTRSHWRPIHQASRLHATNPPRAEDHPPNQSDMISESTYAQPAHDFSQAVGNEEKSHYDKVVAHSKEQQMRAPWMRADSDKPPVSRPRSAGAMTKGKLLTTPSRMLKLILPLTPKDYNSDRKSIEPLALLVHPQQPLSYLERLIQSELPNIKDEQGNLKIPSIIFRAEDATDEDVEPGKLTEAGHDEGRAKEQTGLEDPDDADSDDTTGKTQRALDKDDAGFTDPDHPNFVRWSPSTEIGDFIRDASRGKEFSVEVEGAPAPIYVGVPSFLDRTYYLRTRLRKTAKRLLSMHDIKEECDTLARKGGQRVAQGGFAVLIGWWYLVYRLTFETDLGWDVMEPVTYLVGLSTLIGGYMWFLYHNREVSYRSAMNFTISRRQSKLYEQRGFDLPLWEGLVEEGNRLRREIKMVAEEYDVEWDEKKDEGDEKVSEALRKERKKKAKNSDDDDKKEKEDDD